jgi:hypothetical protein
MIYQFDRPNLRLVRQDLERALSEVAAKHGISLSVGNMTFTATTATVQVKAAVKDGETGVPETPERAMFKLHAPHCGLALDDLDRVVTVDGRRCRISGLRPKAPRRPILLTTLDGTKNFVTSADHVQRLLQDV